MACWSFLRPVLVAFCLLFFQAACRGDCPAGAEGPPKSMTRLRRALLCNYDAHTRPVKNPNTTVPVYLTFDVNYIDMEEHRESISIEGIFRYMWVDAFLSWNPADYEGINYIKLDSMDIWMPDLTVNLLQLNGLESLRPSSCVASFSGMVSCLSKVTVQAPCAQDMRHWPYDTHNCSFYLSSYMYFEHQLNLTGRGIEKSNIRNSRSWELIKWGAAREAMNFTGMYPNPTYYPVLEYYFMVRRHAGSYAAATVLPAFVMLTLVVATFCMGSMVTSRITVCGFVLLGCVTFLNYLLYLIPSNGDNIPVIVTLFRDCMALAAFAIVIAVAVKTLSASPGQPPAWLSASSDWLEQSIVGRVLLLAGDGPPLRDDEAAILEGSGTGACKGSLWAPCALLLDRAAFCACLLVSLFLLMGYVP